MYGYVCQSDISRTTIILENMFKVGFPLVVVKLERFILSPLLSIKVTTDKSALIFLLLR